MAIAAVLLSGALLALLACNTATGAIIVEETFSYATTAWNSAIDGNYNGGTGWSGSWAFAQNPLGHHNGHAAIFGFSGYEPYDHAGPQEAYVAGHGGWLTRDISMALTVTAGSVYYFAADVFTPVTFDSSIYLDIGGYSVGIDSQAAKPGELIMSAPDNASNWNDPKPVGFTGLWGGWQRLQARVEFTGTNSILTAWVNATSESRPSMQVISTSTNFSAVRIIVSHNGDQQYGLADNIVLGTSFGDTVVPEPSTWFAGAVLAVVALAFGFRRRARVDGV